MEPSVGPIRVIDRADTAVVAQLGREIATFNMATVGVPDGRELFALLRDERGALVAGLDGWTWAGTGWIEHLLGTQREPPSRSRRCAPRRGRARGSGA